MVQATSQGDTLQTSVWVAIMGSKRHCTPKSRTPGLTEKDFKGVTGMDPE